ncbi:STAS domain-containing protein [Streptomyces roseus]|uniref:STAS domain-containing protein n=1 Tax=Streptomyces roseus TaxID=66430 RepID=UPI0038067D0C
MSGRGSGRRVRSGSGPRWRAAVRRGVRGCSSWAPGGAEAVTPIRSHVRICGRVCAGHRPWPLRLVAVASLSLMWGVQAGGREPDPPTRAEWSSRGVGLEVAVGDPPRCRVLLGEGAFGTDLLDVRPPGCALPPLRWRRAPTDGTGSMEHDPCVTPAHDTESLVPDPVAPELSFHRLSGPAGTHVLAVVGEVDIDTEPALARALTAALSEPPPPQALTVGCSGLTFCGCAGLNQLLTARHAAAEAGVSFALTALSPQVARLIDLTETRAVFDVLPSPSAQPRTPAEPAGQIPLP